MAGKAGLEEQGHSADTLPLVSGSPTLLAPCHPHCSLLPGYKGVRLVHPWPVPEVNPLPSPGSYPVETVRATGQTDDLTNDCALALELERP